MQYRILITGSNGFVGTYLRRALAQRFPDARIVGLQEAKPETCWTDDIHVDLLDGPGLAQAVAASRPDVVVHLAAQSSVGDSHADATRATWPVNVTGTLNLALAVARYAPHATLLFASSAEVYGGSFSALPATEETPLSPLSAYAKSKVAAERILADVLPRHTRLIVARPFNHTGPGQREAFVLPSFAGQIAWVEAGLQDSLLVGDTDVWRDFLDVRDVVDAYVRLIESAQRLPRRTLFNVASGKANRLADLLDLLRALATVDIKVGVDPSRLRRADMRFSLGDARRLNAATGWAPRIAIAKTLSDLLEAARAEVRLSTVPNRLRCARG